MPDLIVNSWRLDRSTEVTYRYFAPDACEVVEGCVRAPGVRKLLLFDVGIANIGRGDAVIGDPNERPDIFEFSPCHDHMHLQGFAVFKLLRRNGRLVVSARKQGFCMRDERRYSSTAPAGRYDCDYQGITAGWQDIYYKWLDCQWLDITGVPPGVYILRVKANPQGLIPERNYYNNVASVQILVPY